MQFPPVFGKIVFEGLASTKFWIRAFGLEREIAYVQAKINEKPERKEASVPLISQYEVDAERLNFYYAMNLKVDALGIQNGIGLICFSDKANSQKAIAQRDELADRMLESLTQRHYDEELDLEMHEIQARKEI